MTNSPLEIFFNIVHVSNTHNTQINIRKHMIKIVFGVKIVKIHDYHEQQWLAVDASMAVFSMEQRAKILPCKASLNIKNESILHDKHISNEIKRRGIHLPHLPHMFLSPSLMVLTKLLHATLAPTPNAYLTPPLSIMHILSIMILSPASTHPVLLFPFPPLLPLYIPPLPTNPVTMTLSYSPSPPPPLTGLAISTRTALSSIPLVAMP